MLSNVEIVKQLGKNIAIYPIFKNSIKGASVNLTASKYAWSLSTKKSTVVAKDGKHVIIINKHDTTLVETNETVGVSNRIGGTFHSRVYNVSLGLGHVGTTLNPGWVGPSLIALHNHTDNDIEISVDSPFVTLIFSYLNVPSSIKEDNPPSRTDILQRFGIVLSKEENENLHETPIHKDFEQVCLKMKEDDEYKALKDNKFETFKSFFSRINMILSLVGVSLIFCMYALYRSNNLKELYECVKYITVAYIPGVFIHIITKINRG